MNVLIVGGAGYIGSHVARAVTNNGWTPIIFDNFSTGYRHNCERLACAFVEGDLRSSEDLEKAFSTNKIDAVMHFAACALVEESMTNPEKYYENNLLGSFNLLKAMKRHNVSALVFSSTCATYGTPEKIPINEKTLQNPVNPYGGTKLAVERMIFDYGRAYGLKAAVLRYFNAAGASFDGLIGEEHNPETHAIPNCLRAAAGLMPQFNIFGNDYETPDGTALRDYIHVEDLAEAHVLSLKWICDHKENLTLNLGAGVGQSVLQIIETAKRVTGKKFEVIQKARRAGDPPALVADISLAKKSLSWNPTRSDLDNIIATAWNFMKNPMN